MVKMSITERGIMGDENSGLGDGRTAVATVDNPYIRAKQQEYAAIRSSVDGLLNTAGTENRGLTDAEMATVRSQTAAGKALFDELELLMQNEHRNRAVAEMAISIPSQGGSGGHTGNGGKGAAKADPRDPGHYRALKQGGTNSFFGDLYRQKLGDQDANRRINEHAAYSTGMRDAMTTSANGVGVIPPKWLTDKFEVLARQGRALANAVRNIDLGDDPRPMSLPKQTAGTDAAVADQAAENDPISAGEEADWDSDVDTVTPKATAGKQVTSRQLLDMSSPAIDELLYSDLLSVYNLKTENRVAAAIAAVAGTAVTTFPADVTTAGVAAGDFVHGSDAIDAVIDMLAAVRSARKMPANVLTMGVNRWAKFKKLKDTTGRYLIGNQSYGPQNVVGIGEVNTDGDIEGVPVIVTDGVNSGTFPDNVYAVRTTDVILFETSVMRFRFEEQAGPESVVLGIWGYQVAVVRQLVDSTHSRSVRKLTITAATR